LPNYPSTPSTYIVVYALLGKLSRAFFVSSERKEPLEGRE